MAGPLKGMRAWADRVGTNEVARFLTKSGIADQAACDAVTATWDEDLFVDTALTNRAFDMLLLGMKGNKLSAANMERIKAAASAQRAPIGSVVNIAMLYPVGERAIFQAAVEPVLARRFASQLEMGRLYMKYTVLQGLPMIGAGTSDDDLTRLLLAPEALGLNEADHCKQEIKNHAARLAKLRLRAEGTTFVVKNGINPLVVKVQPVIDALNAPACEGLEAALRALGAKVADCERTELKKMADVWATQMMSGDLAGGEASRYLGKVAIAMGAEAYNRFVDEFNNGTGVGP
ncbi:MAG: hypothetical protein NTV49_04415 [Kiritimatiellaeota bacterium]|nr:hypothetical protein [Kiritimatiellota bacterium]